MTVGASMVLLLLVATTATGLNPSALASARPTDKIAIFFDDHERQGSPVGIESLAPTAHLTAEKPPPQAGGCTA